MMPTKRQIPPCESRAIATSMFLGFGFLILFFLPIPADAAQDVSECLRIQDREKRLACYDRILGRKPGDTVTQKEPAETVPLPKAEKASFFSQLWEMEEDTRRGKYAIKLHQSTYALPITYNGSPNVAAVREADPEKDLKKPEVTFQMSVKAKLWQDIFGRKADLWLGYTQRSFWQLYNFADSSPFRETNYEPEILLNFRTNYRILGLKGSFINVGLNHQSNGQSEPLSRSWNRVVLNFGFEREPLAFQLKTWYRLPESAEVDDNPNIEKYLGYGELWAYYFHKKHRFGAMVRNNLNFHTNRGAVQLEWSFPLIFENFAGYLQYYVGYGENLLDYNHKVNRIGLGFILLDWD
jgi:phospholipase A1